MMYRGITTLKAFLSLVIPNNSFLFYFLLCIFVPNQYRQAVLKAGFLGQVIPKLL